MRLSARSFLILPFVACMPATDRTSADIPWMPMDVRHAKAFSIAGSGNEKLLCLLDAERGDTLALYLVGNGSGRGMRLPIKPARVAVGSTTHMPYINALGLQDRIVAVAFPEHQFDPALGARVASGEVTALTSLDGPGREVIISRRADLLLGYPFGHSGWSGVAGDGPPLVLIAEYAEPHPLGRAEWLRFFGVLFDREALADSLYKAVEERYERLRQRAARVEERPKVFFGSAWMGQWHVPGGDSHIARLIADAGGEYVFQELPGTGNINMGMEQVVDVAGEAQWWGMVLRKQGGVAKADMTGGDRRLEHIGGAQGANLFAANSAESDFFGQALLEPDVLLADLIHLFHPHLLPEHRPVYFKRVAQ